MKKAICLFLALAALGLAGCGSGLAASPTPAPTAVPEYSFTRETMPRLAGGLTLAPLGGAVAAILLGESREEVADLLAFGATDAAWEALAAGEAGLALAPAAADMPAGLDTAVIARDALVFWTGAGNRVDGLTSAQLADVLAGRVTNWAELGGADAEIRLTLPEAGSGSLAAAAALLGLSDEPAGTWAGFDSSAAALGCGFLYGAEAMGLADGMKLLAVDGVAPTAETVASGEYPLVAGYLAGVRADEAEDSPARVLWLWLQGDVGQAFVAAQGYVR